MENQITITSKLLGGVGNQMFQIAIAYALAKEYNANLLFELFQFSGCRQGSHPSKYYASLYSKLNFQKTVSIDIQISEDGFVYQDISEHIKRAILFGKRVISLFGYWQSDLYFRKYSKEIKQLFTPEGGFVKYLETHSTLLEKYPELKLDHDYCFIGVRRGDYITYADVHNPCGMTYYRKAMERMNKKRYYIASDDIEWCKKQFCGDQYIFFEIDDDLEQLCLNTLFKNYIISNSSYYWWGSFLSRYEKPFVIAPDKWVFGPTATYDKYSTIYREDMIVLERPVETE
jgi:hypothetical protein